MSIPLSLPCASISTWQEIYLQPTTPTSYSYPILLYLSTLYHISHLILPIHLSRYLSSSRCTSQHGKKILRPAFAPISSTPFPTLQTHLPPLPPSPPQPPHAKYLPSTTTFYDSPTVLYLGPKSASSTCVQLQARLRPLRSRPTMVAEQSGGRDGRREATGRGRRRHELDLGPRNRLTLPLHIGLSLQKSRYGVPCPYVGLTRISLALGRTASNLVFPWYSSQARSGPCPILLSGRGWRPLGLPISNLHPSGLSVVPHRSLSPPYGSFPILGVSPIPLGVFPISALTTHPFGLPHLALRERKPPFWSPIFASPLPYGSPHLGPHLALQRGPTLSLWSSHLALPLPLSSPSSPSLSPPSLCLRPISLSPPSLWSSLISRSPLPLVFPISLSPSLVFPIFSLFSSFSSLPSPHSLLILLSPLLTVFTFPSPYSPLSPHLALTFPHSLPSYSPPS
ncbi:hypothetical protein C7M84_013638 [Penaeus vannamei]|uniref:Uncharacterized protein n=1 Tax=Penaeus vannamei TaxID=6689 RepID=A0A3R7NW13_PENVA|nr:hypothetical protein C7M84_013638 [Penaeus vannamei]